jgi:GAF domain-containing protein
MPFAAGLRDSLQLRETRAPSEFEEGHSLEKVLERHLLTVEEMAHSQVITSILLLSPDGKRLSHGAAPSLPRSYMAAIDGTEIGPSVGSCGTAAYLDRPVYVTDIATDPLWEHYRHLALPHGLRSCWSTPIRDPVGSIIGTFAIYHRTVGSPTLDEIEAIDLITDHVAAVIILARGDQDLDGQSRESGKPRLKLVHGADGDSASGSHPFDRLLLHIAALESKAADLDRCGADAGSTDEGQALRAAAEDCRQLASAIRLRIDQHNLAKPSAP